MMSEPVALANCGLANSAQPNMTTWARSATTFRSTPYFFKWNSLSCRKATYSALSTLNVTEQIQFTEGPSGCLLAVWVLGDRFGVPALRLWLASTECKCAIGG